MAPLDLDSEYLTPAEAAMVADVHVRDVNRVFDEKILPKEFFATENGRRLRAVACPLISFYSDTADSLTAGIRSHFIDRVIKRGEFESAFVYLVSIEFEHAHNKRSPDYTKWLSAIRKNLTIQEKVLTLDFAPYLEETSKRYSSLLEARELVVEDPEILGGVPTIRGTRVPVYDVAASLQKGISIDRLRSAYPSLDERAIELARIYSEARPLRGRPRETTPRLTRPSARRVLRRPRK